MPCSAISATAREGFVTYEAAYDDEIFHTVFTALTECGKGWCGEYNMPEENFNEYICIMMRRRFADTRMVDPCVRPCRQPMRKLSQGERFIEPALTALKHGVEPVGIVAGIRAVLDYDYAEDEQAVELQRRIAAEGLPAVLEQGVCGLQPRRAFDADDSECVKRKESGLCGKK